MINMAVRENDHRNLASASAQDRGEVIVVERTGVNHGWGSQARITYDPGVRAIKRHRTRIRGDEQPQVVRDQLTDHQLNAPPPSGWDSAASIPTPFRSSAAAHIRSPGRSRRRIAPACYWHPP